MTENAKPRIRVRSTPYGVMAGLLTACMVTFIGVVNGLEPFVILSRASISATVITFAVSIGISIVAMANAQGHS